MPKYFTPEGFEKLKKELEHLKTDKRKEIAKQLRKAIAFGDLSENASYHEAKESQAFLEGEILELENLIRNAVVKSGGRTERVGVGSSVLLADSKGNKEKFKIVGVREADPLEKKISIDSPFGEALLDKSEGALVEIETLEGKNKYKIVKIE